MTLKLLPQWKCSKNWMFAIKYLGGFAIISLFLYCFMVNPRWIPVMGRNQSKHTVTINLSMIPSPYHRWWDSPCFWLVSQWSDCLLIGESQCLSHLRVSTSWLEIKCSLHICRHEATALQIIFLQLPWLQSREKS